MLNRRRTATLVAIAALAALSWWLASLVLTKRQSSDSPNGAPDPRTEELAGLHYTAAEVTIWRRRAESGPYRRRGDVSVNSPGDWERITSEARAFLEDPSQALWTGPTILDWNGCVAHVAGPRNNNNPPLEGPSRLRDAAFYYLITQDVSYANAVKAQLLAQAAEPGVQFSNYDQFCSGRLDYHGSPLFNIANWMTKLLYSYDYLGAQSFTADERARLNSWFYDAAEWFEINLNADLDTLFVDRWEGVYTPTQKAATTSTPVSGYYGSKPIYLLHRMYNNRRATVARFIGLTAIKLSREGFDGVSTTSLEHLESAAKLFVKEWLRFSVFPEGFFGEFERWTPELPDLGWGYANNVLTPLLVIADAFARDGDTELLEYGTTAGALGTESSSPKTLLAAARMLGRYIDGTVDRYATNKSSRKEDANYRIDGLDPADGGEWAGAHDTQLAIANVYYRDDYLKDVYMRTGLGMRNYPERPASSGQHLAWSGDWGTLPGTLFMFGQMEGAAWPYKRVAR
jgi:hypothetical protein